MFGTPERNHCRKTTARITIAQNWMKLSGKVRINGKKKRLAFGRGHTSNDSIAPPCLWALWHHILGKVQHVFGWNFQGRSGIIQKRTDLTFWSDRLQNDSIAPPCLHPFGTQNALTLRAVKQWFSTSRPTWNIIIAPPNNRKSAILD